LENSCKQRKNNSTREIERKFATLIANALKFTNEGGTIAVFTSVNSNQIEITVSDNGIGISEDVKSKILKIDFPVSQSGTSDEIGSGLDLILCKEFREKQQ
jgi:two-component system sensor histidine kinase/response regulator